MRVLLFGATGTIGQAVAHALKAQGHEAIAVGRRDGGILPTRIADVGDTDDLLIRAFDGEPFDAVVSCLASRSGAPKDAWAIDHDAHQAILKAAQKAGTPRFVLLSALCVQEPKLAFQKAKRAFEQSLQNADLTWTIVRPTAFFKSLSGQVARVAAGKPFLAFADGKRTACKPISDRDLATFVVHSLSDPDCRNAICPIGGPGPAITPIDQARMLETLLGRSVPVRTLPVGAMKAIIAALRLAGAVSPKAAEKAELARIGLFYGTHSMLVRNAESGQYDAAATPETGSDLLLDHYRALLAGDITHDLADHAVF